MAMGGALSLSAALVGLPALSFALGVYLPLATLATIFVGGIVRRFVEGRQESVVESGILCASGFVAGEGLAGVLVVGWAYYTDASRYQAPAPSVAETWIALATLLVAAVALIRSTKKA
jgi:uncharacterized oligopeptide transporter (OPT) family protein